MDTALEQACQDARHWHERAKNAEARIAQLEAENDLLREQRDGLQYASRLSEERAQSVEAQRDALEHALATLAAGNDKMHYQIKQLEAQRDALAAALRLVIALSVERLKLR